jgi:hypothetical protein
VLLALAAAAAPASAAGLAIDVVLVPDRITAGGEHATLTIVVRSGGLTLPDAPVPRVAGLTFDPAGTAQNFSMVQGRVERSVTVAYRVLAGKAGAYTIPALRVSQGKESAESKPILLTVLPPSSTAPRAPAARESWGRGGGPPEVFARLLVDRDHVYWNQEIVARLRIYARVPLEGAPDWTAPETQGFWIEDLGAPTAGSARVGDHVYVVSEIRWALFPTKTGRLTIGPSRIRCRVNRVVPPPDPWSALGFPDVESQDVTVETDPVPITVEEVPAAAPEGYSGAVGSYSLAVRVDRGTVPAGEPAIVTTILRGEGNIASLHDPEVTAPATVRRYVAGSSTQIDRSGKTLTGTRTQQVAILSDTPGTIRVGPVRFAWFEPSEGRFHSVSSESIRIRVTPATGHGTAAVGGVRAPEPTAPPRASRGPRGTLSLGPPVGALAVSALSIAAYAGLLLLSAARRRRARDPRAIRRAALDAAARSVAAARSGLAAKNAESAASRAGEGLLLGLAARYDLPGTGFSRAELLEGAERRGADGRVRKEVVELLDALDAIAFAPPDTRARHAVREIKAAEALLARWLRELSA